MLLGRRDEEKQSNRLLYLENLELRLTRKMDSIRHFEPIHMPVGSGQADHLSASNSGAEAADAIEEDAMEEEGEEEEYVDDLRLNDSDDASTNTL